MLPTSDYNFWHRDSFLLGADSLHLEKFGMTKCGPNDGSYLFCSFVFMHFITKGEGIFCVDGKKFDAGRGTAMFFFPGQRVHYYNKGEQPWEYFWGKICGTAVDTSLKLMGVSVKHPLIHISDIDSLEMRIRKIFRNLQSYPEEPFVPYASGWELLSSIHMTRNDNSSLGVSIPLIDQARSFIENTTPKLPNVSELAQKLGVSRVTLYRLFREHVGCTPSEYLDKILYDRACDLLSDPAFSIKEIADLCGLSPQYFCNWFRRLSGVSPIRFRKKKAP
jgi:AraC-like DNA-binding protein